MLSNSTVKLASSEHSTTPRADWVAAVRPVWDQFSDEIGVEVIEAAVSYNEMTN